MILREIKTAADCDFVTECYRDWGFPIYPIDVRNWAIRYKSRPFEEQGRICDIDGPKGFVLYQKSGALVTIYEMCVHPYDRGKGIGKQIWQAMFQDFQKEGVVVGEFEARPGIVADKILGGQFENVGNTEGKFNPLVKGRVTVDNEYLR